MNRLTLACLALILGVLAFGTGCGNSAGARLMGKWEVHTTQATKAVEDAAAAQKDNPFGGMMANMAKGAMQSMKIELEFKPQNQVSFNAAVMGQAINRSGTWKVVRASGNEVTVAIKMDAEGAERETTIKFVDNDTVEMVPPANAGPQQQATFRRVKK